MTWVTAPMVIRYATITHWMSARLPPRSRRMSGRPMATIVMSMTTSELAAITRARTARPARAEDSDAPEPGSSVRGSGSSVGGSGGWDTADTFASTARRSHRAGPGGDGE